MRIVPRPDATLPSGDGAELALWARQARARDRAAMRRLLTALGPTMLRVVRSVLGPNATDAEDVLQEASVPNTAFLQKPFEPSQLASALSDLLRQSPVAA